MIKSTGVDIIEISRIEKAVNASERFLKRVFTACELNRKMGGRQKYSYLAGRFAAKEAVSKALGTGIGKIGWQDIEIISDNKGKPVVKLYGEATITADQLGVKEISLSISHCHEYAVAFAVAY